MKKNILLVLSFAFLLIGKVQAQETVKKEFTITVDQSKIQVLPGESTVVKINLNRSKAFENTDISLDLATSLPEGVTVTFNEGNNPMIEREMVITVDAGVQAFDKTLILKGNSRKINKGIMLNLSVPATALTAN